MIYNGGSWGELNKYPEKTTYRILANGSIDPVLDVRMTAGVTISFNIFGTELSDFMEDRIVRDEDNRYTHGACCNKPKEVLYEDCPHITKCVNGSNCREFKSC